MRRESGENPLWVALTLMVVFGAVGFTIVAVQVGECTKRGSTSSPLSSRGLRACVPGAGRRRFRGLWC